MKTERLTIPLPEVLSWFILLALLAAGFPTCAAGADAPPKIQLFGTVEFKRPLNSLPAWLKLLDRNRKVSIFVNGTAFKRSVTWESFKKQAAGKSGLELIKFVNSFWNAFPYKEDIVNWGVEDYWAIPNEFLKKSGDCEDYAIIKYFTLKELGFSTDQMRIVVLRDTIRNLAHAVLAVYINNDAYILDNVSSATLSHKRLTHYVPQYSINENSRWAHLKGRPIRR
ncbi:MAG: transglutaminase-like cysteine peptidase [Desulfovibrionaceae bacterium]|nr:transglutaminase-like cysteine peptidase [Desulfovibrionaceae bacterium]